MLRTNLYKIENATLRDEARLIKVLRYVERAVNSEVFKRRFLKSDFSSTSLTADDIYRILFEDNLDPNKKRDSKMHLHVVFYTDDNSAAAGTANESRIRLNTAYFHKRPLPKVANTVVHEWLHTVGFHHRTMLEHESVPFKTGKLVENIIRENKYKYNWWERAIHQLRDWLSNF